MTGGSESGQLPQLAAYMQVAAVLVADMSPTSRPTLRKLLGSLGAKTHLVEVADSYEEALERVATSRPAVVFADFHIGRHTALDLFEAWRRVVPDRLRSLFVVLTEGGSPWVLSAVAECGMDAVLSRPFTYNGLHEKVLEALAPKLDPPAHAKMLEAARRFMELGKSEQALTASLAARERGSEGAGAHYIEGAARRALGDLPGALAALEAGLAADPAHYRCRLALYELHLEGRRPAQALEAALGFAPGAPLNPRRIPELVRLCLATERFSEIPRLHDVVLGLDPHDDALTRTLCAGLVICGKQWIARGATADALDAFRRAELSSRSNAGLMREILIALYAGGHDDEAAEMRKRVTAEAGASADVRIAALEREDRKGPSAQAFLDAQGLISEGVRDPRLYGILIRQARGLGRPRNVIEELVWQACSAFPERRDEFEAA